MPYEIFSRRIVKTTAPTISLTPYGRLNLNKASAAIFEENAVEQVLMLWDAEKRKLALRPITKKDPRAYMLGKKSKGVLGFSVKTFLDHYGIKYEGGAHAYPATWNEQDSLLEAELPPEVVKTSQQQSSVTQMPKTQKVAHK